MMDELNFAKLSFNQAAIRTIYISFTSKGIKELSFKKLQHSKDYNNNHQLSVKTKIQLEQYFLGKRKKFSCPLDLEGTSFQKSAWNVLQSIPYGKSLSYKEQAFKMNNPKAARAVGNANGKNPVPIIVPCHRVLHQSGEIGGFSAGLSYKKKLLNIEKITFNS